MAMLDIDIRALLPYIVVIGTFGLTVLHYLRNFFRTGLRSVPGPFLAHLSSLYRIKLVWKGGAVKNYSALHRKYGPIVRTGSNHVSISDPAMISLIYGISSKFRKVRKNLHSIQFCLSGKRVFLMVYFLTCVSVSILPAFTALL